MLTKSGLIYTGSNESLTMLLWNAVGAIVLILFHAVTSAILFFALHSLHLFRVQPAQELEGLDVIKHDEPAYAFGTLLTVMHSQHCVVYVTKESPSNITQPT